MRYRITVTGIKSPKQIEEESRQAQIVTSTRSLDDKVYQSAALREQYIFNRIIKVLETRFHITISDKGAHLEFSGGGAGSPKVYKESPFDPEHPLDFEFFYFDTLVAMIEVSGSNKCDDLDYSFPEIPIRTYKIDAVEKLKNQVPTFYVFNFWTKFTYLGKTIDMPRDYWTTYEKARKCLKRTLKTNFPKKDTMQRNYMVPWAEWTSDVDNLAEELYTLVSKVRIPEKEQNLRMPRRLSRV